MGADRVATAQVAFDHQIVLFVEQRAAERTSGNARHAADALFGTDFVCASLLIHADCVDQAGFDTGRIFALEAYYRNVQILVTGSERVDAASARFAVDS